MLYKIKWYKNLKIKNQQYFTPYLKTVKDGIIALKNLFNIIIGNLVKIKILQDTNLLISTKKQVEVLIKTIFVKIILKINVIITFLILFYMIYKQYCLDNILFIGTDDLRPNENENINTNEESGLSFWSKFAIIGIIGVVVGIAIVGYLYYNGSFTSIESPIKLNTEININPNENILIPELLNNNPEININPNENILIPELLNNNPEINININNASQFINYIKQNNGTYNLEFNSTYTSLILQILEINSQNLLGGGLSASNYTAFADILLKESLYANESSMTSIATGLYLNESINLKMLSSILTQLIVQDLQKPSGNLSKEFYYLVRVLLSKIPQTEDNVVALIEESLYLNIPQIATGIFMKDSDIINTLYEANLIQTNDLNSLEMSKISHEAELFLLNLKNVSEFLKEYLSISGDANEITLLNDPINKTVYDLYNITFTRFINYLCNIR